MVPSLTLERKEERLGERKMFLMHAVNEHRWRAGPAGSRTVID